MVMLRSLILATANVHIHVHVFFQTHVEKFWYDVGTYILDRTTATSIGTVVFYADYL